MVACKFCNRVYSEALDICKGCGALLPKKVPPPPPPVAFPQHVATPIEMPKQVPPAITFAKRVLGLVWRIFCGFFIIMSLAMVFEDFALGNASKSPGWVAGFVFAFIFSIPFLVSWIRRNYRPYPYSSGFILPIIGCIGSLVLLASVGVIYFNIGFALSFLWFLGLSIIRLARERKSKNQTE